MNDEEYGELVADTNKKYRIDTLYIGGHEVVSFNASVYDLYH